MVLQSGGQADLTSENGVVYYRSLSRTATLLKAITLEAISNSGLTGVEQFDILHVYCESSDEDNGAA
jgi:hypothetical protein